jgi:DNA-binding beta-propeller fold protein YncE
MTLFPMQFSRARVHLAKPAAALAVAALLVGCGSQYRPPVTPINTTGPAAQPQSFAAVVSAPSPTAPGIATIIDYSGDTVMAQAPIGPGPVLFTLDASGSTGYTVNSDGTLTNFQVSTSLQEKNEQFSTLPPTTDSVNLFAPITGLWLADLNGDVTDVLTGYPETFKLAVPVATTPVTIAGISTATERYYAISQDFDSPQGSDPNGVACNVSPATAPVNGEADSIEVSTYTVSGRIALTPSAGALLGQCPVYAVQSPDGQRLFVLNRGSDTISVINSQLNTLDACTPFHNQAGQLVSCHPALPLSLTAVNALNAITPGSGNPPNGTAGMGTVAGPVYAEYNSATNQLVVANYDGATVSVIDVSLDEYGNDSATFGTTFTIPVGANPASVTVLNDGSRAYTANQADKTVTIVNLTSHTVEKSLPVIGHPRTVVSTQNSLYGKVYVASPDSPYVTILRTDQDIVDTTVLVEGNVVDVRVSTQNAVSGNTNISSRRPGHGQPCYLPPSLLPTNSTLTLAACQTLPVAGQ